MKVREHSHPLTLIDLQVEYPPYDEDEEEEEDEDEGGDQTKKEGFHGVTCERCGEEIHMYHRYYYKCTSSTCDFSLHKYCGELPQRLDHTLHAHPLIIWQKYYGWKCKICQSSHSKPGEVCYFCDTCNDFIIDVKCAVEVGKNMINHPCHPHLLICAISQPILCHCKACGREHKGVFYQCNTCTNFTIHSDCAFLPKTLLIQQTSHSAFHHTHPLTLSYSFPKEERRARHYPNCRVCGQDFYATADLWSYKCDECMYYVHLDCATSTREPFMSILMPPGLGLVKKNYKDAEHPHLLHLPFPDETYSIPRHLLILQQEKRDYEVSLNHASHLQHPLILVDHTHGCNGQASSSSSLLMCHDPMKKTQLLCNGCLRPITSTMPFYKCDQLICNFALHEWCTRLPPKIENHPHHPQHPLLLKYPNVLPHFFGVFRCAVCRLDCNGFAYCCEECDNYSVDVTCGFIPPKITHKAHPNHLLSLVQKNPSNDDKYCPMCRYTYWSFRYIYKCNHCDISIHPACALLLVETIRHKYDKHPMHLSYLPIENHKSPYFCEICEEDLDPHESFYHCKPCAQSVHAACAPLILQSETHTYGWYDQRIIYYFVNVKFGGILNTNRHQHPLSFAQGLESDGRCELCLNKLRCTMIFKCLECKSAICYDCCKGNNT